MASAALPLKLHQTDRRLAEARQTVRRYSLLSLAVGIIPVPFFDILGVGSMQFLMLKKLADHYGVPKPKRQLIRRLVASLIGGYAPARLAFGGVGSLLKAIPLVGPLAGLVSLPAIAAATTYAVGKVFVQHFESGGTFLDFDPESVKEAFQEQFEKGRVEFDLPADAPQVAYSTHDMKVSQVRDAIANISDPRLLTAMRESEKLHPDFEGGRASVLGAITARLKQVLEDEDWAEPGPGKARQKQQQQARERAREGGGGSQGAKSPQ